jgi:hypothetical protein
LRSEFWAQVFSPLKVKKMEKQQQAETINKSRYGFVYRWRRGIMLQIEFGNMLLNYDTDNFRLFARLVQHIDTETDEDIFYTHTRRPFLIYPLGSCAQTYCFSRDEIMDLKVLLNGAISMLDLQKSLRNNLIMN